MTLINGQRFSPSLSFSSGMTEFTCHVQNRGKIERRKVKRERTCENRMIQEGTQSGKVSESKSDGQDGGDRTWVRFFCPFFRLMSRMNLVPVVRSSLMIRRSLLTMHQKQENLKRREAQKHDHQNHPNDYRVSTDRIDKKLLFFFFSSRHFLLFLLWLHAASPPPLIPLVLILLASSSSPSSHLFCFPSLSSLLCFLFPSSSLISLLFASSSNLRVNSYSNHPIDISLNSWPKFHS